MKDHLRLNPNLPVYFCEYIATSVGYGVPHRKKGDTSAAQVALAAIYDITKLTGQVHHPPFERVGQN